MSKSGPLVKGRDGRDAKGRFVKGWKGGPGGNPNQHRVLRLKRALLEAVSPAQVAKVIRKMGAMGARGDVAAAKVYLEHAVGKPEHRYDPRQAMPPEGEQQSKGPQYTAQERLIIARTMAAQAERELRGEEAIEVEGEEVRDE